jgi:hypothetical protein
MLSLGDPNDTSDNSTPRPSASIPVTVYIVTDTYYPTAADFDVGKGIVNIDSVHSTAEAANVRAKKIMFIHERGEEDLDKDKIIEEIRQGLYSGIGIGGREKGCYARKCEVEEKAVDVDEDESSEESLDTEDWNMG